MFHNNSSSATWDDAMDATLCLYSFSVSLTFSLSIVFTSFGASFSLSFLLVLSLSLEVDRERERALRFLRSRSAILISTTLWLQIVLRTPSPVALQPGLLVFHFREHYSFRLLTLPQVAQTID
jgi:hypothetical protein